jgi:DMSO/TMAO reductase YedYZ heme-binding membrane subunit
LYLNNMLYAKTKQKKSHVDAFIFSSIHFLLSYTKQCPRTMIKEATIIVIMLFKYNNGTNNKQNPKNCPTSIQ